MYISEFVVGIATTILAEFFLIIGYAFWKMIRRKK
jgi:hypothetical protein